MQTVHPLPITSQCNHLYRDIDVVLAGLTACSPKLLQAAGLGAQRAAQRAGRVHAVNSIPAVLNAIRCI